VKRRRRREAGRPVERPDYARIAVLEWELFGIEPPAGTVAAAAVGVSALARTIAGAARDSGRDPCAHEEVVSVRAFGDAVEVGVGAGCGVRVPGNQPR
jgi:hypothetical protein